MRLTKNLRRVVTLIKIILDKRAHDILCSCKNVVYWELSGNNLILTYSCDGVTKAYLVPNQCDGTLHIFTEKNQIFKQLTLQGETVSVSIDVAGHMLQFSTRFGTICAIAIEEGNSEFHINPAEQTTIVPGNKLNYLAKVLSAVSEYGKNLGVNPTIQIDEQIVTIAHHQFVIELNVSFGFHAILYAKTLLNLINSIPHPEGLAFGVSSDGIYASDGHNEMSVAQCIRDVCSEVSTPFKQSVANGAYLNCEVLREDLLGMLSVFKLQPYNQAALLFNETSVGFRILSPECNFSSEIPDSIVFLTNLAMLKLITRVSDSYYFKEGGNNLLCLSTTNMNMKCVGQLFTKI